jgi:excinuclease ABC subunit C
VDVEVIVTDTELEALILENNLIRQHKPKYNIDLKDDKSFPFLRITNEPYPRVFLTRRPVKDGSKYFGPYSDLFHLKGLLRVLRGMLKIRTCNLPLTDESVAAGKFRACLEFHIGRCHAPCIGNDSNEVYARRVQDFVDVVSGRGSLVIERLEKEMTQLADDMKFEQAAQLRDWLSSLDNLTQRQKVISAEPINRDVFGLAMEDETGVVVILQVRNGRMLERLHYRITGLKDVEVAEVLESAFERYYTNPVTLPDEVFLPFEMPEQGLLSTWLRQLAGRKIDVKVPERGDKAHLVEMAQKNAELLLGEAKAARETESRTPMSLLELKRVLRLSNLPKEIAAFDVSTLMGTSKVASMVVFRDGRPARSQYRKFKIRTVEGIDDFASMREVVQRRFGRLRRDKLPCPDLILIDGGKGQLTAAVEALTELRIKEQPIVGLAKRLEEVYVPGDPMPLSIPKTSSALKLLQQIRDEAHRFAITYHRQLRRNNSLRSLLEDIEGIGPARRKALLKHFGSLPNLETATLEQIQSVNGMTRPSASRVYEFIQQRRSITRA